MRKIICCLLAVTMLFVGNYSFAGVDLERALSTGSNGNFTSKGDLSFLNQLSDEELLPLVKLMKDRVSNQLPDDVMEHPRAYLYDIINELERYAGNTFMNIWRGGKGVPYRELLEDVCKKQDIEIGKNMSVDRMGAALIQHTFATALDNMTAEQKAEFFANLEESMGRERYEELLKEAGGKSGLWALSGNTVAMLLVKSAGFGLYKASAVIVFGVFHAVGLSVPHALAFGGLAAGIKTTIGILFGPVVWTIIGVWCAINVASPATRVTVPAAIYIESMRIFKGDNDYVNSINYKENREQKSEKTVKNNTEKKKIKGIKPGEYKKEKPIGIKPE